MVFTNSNGRNHGFLSLYSRLYKSVNKLRQVGSVVVVLICVVLSVPWFGRGTSWEGSAVWCTSTVNVWLHTRITRKKLSPMSHPLPTSLRECRHPSGHPQKRNNHRHNTKSLVNLLQKVYAERSILWESACQLTIWPKQKVFNIRTNLLPFHQSDSKSLPIYTIQT